MPVAVSAATAATAMAIAWERVMIMSFVLLLGFRETLAVTAGCVIERTKTPHCCHIEQIGISGLEGLIGSVELLYAAPKES
ncbi:hypothetical protein GCM10010121_067580 [Streptomyces brasiliensis]|uniref:Uncharacterized protein n=1 Tax=Streptomyces brasiliensis TaxID=1954 RepID=A0A917L716_9ACTN|nr:hypothetical protein GCM10010121_067580 [Streptomyces brasiliensis]